MANVLPTESEDGSDVADSVTPVELFFDLVFVFAFVQVTTFLAADVTWVRVARAIALLAVLWWGWVTYTWLTDAQRRVLAFHPRKRSVRRGPAV